MNRFSFSLLVLGVLIHKIPPKYSNFKDFTSIVPVPKKGTQVALIDADKGNIIDVKSKRFVRSVARWNGVASSNGRLGVFAPSRGGLEIIELRHGKAVRTLIPKVAEGVFSNMTSFNRTDEFVLYYHNGRRTLRVFRYENQFNS